MIEELTSNQESLLLYLETCMVDGGSMLSSAKMNQDDWDNAATFKEEGVLEVVRLKMADVRRYEYTGKGYTHRVSVFSDKAWEMAHRIRRERGQRIVGKKEWAE